MLAHRDDGDHRGLGEDVADVARLQEVGREQADRPRRAATRISSGPTPSRRRPSETAELPRVARATSRGRPVARPRLRVVRLTACRPYGYRVPYRKKPYDCMLVKLFFMRLKDQRGSERRSEMKTDTVFKRAFNDALDLSRARRSASRLPSENALSARLGVSRTTVRKVLAALSDRGLVDRHGRLSASCARRAQAMQRFPEAETVPTAGPGREALHGMDAARQCAAGDA